MGSTKHVCGRCAGGGLRTKERLYSCVLNVWRGKMWEGEVAFRRMAGRAQGGQRPVACPSSSNVVVYEAEPCAAAGGGAATRMPSASCGVLYTILILYE